MVSFIHRNAFSLRKGGIRKKNHKHWALLLLLLLFVPIVVAVYFPSKNNNKITVETPPDRASSERARDFAVNATNASVQDVAKGIYGPSIAIDANDTIHISYACQRVIQSEIFYMKCINGVWSTPIQLTVGSSYRGVDDLDTGTKLLIDSKGNMYIFWQAFTGYTEVWYIEKTGILWSQIKKAATGEQDESLQVAIDSMNRVHIIYTSFANGCIIHKFLNESGWSPIIQVSHGTSGVAYPSISIDYQDRLHFTWTNTSGGNAICYSQTTWNGTILINDTEPTNSNENEEALSNMLVDADGCVYLVFERSWYSQPDGYGLRHHILFYKYDQDLKIKINETIISYSFAYAAGDDMRNRPMCWDRNGRLHIVNQDKRNGNTEIYHRSSSLSEFSIQNISIQPTTIGLGQHGKVEVCINYSGEVPGYVLIQVRNNGDIIAVENASMDDTSASFQYNWTPSEIGEYFIEITILPYSVRDSNTENNNLNTTVIVGQAIPEFDNKIFIILVLLPIILLTNPRSTNKRE